MARCASDQQVPLLLHQRREYRRQLELQQHWEHACTGMLIHKRGVLKLAQKHRLHIDKRAWASAK